MNKLLKNLLFLFTSILIIQSTNAQTPWRFAVLGDTHIGTSDTVAEMIPYMLADSVDFVLVCGDLAEGGLACTEAHLVAQLSEWRDIFLPLYEQGIGVYAVRGNHENDAQGSIVAWNSVFTGQFSFPDNGPVGEKNLTYSFSNKNALIIGFDNYVNIHTVNQNWLEQQLSQNTQPHIFTFGHEAAFKVFHSDCLDDSLASRDTFWQSISEAGSRVYFCGHDHFLDVASVTDEDDYPDNDLYQYLIGSGGGWLMSNYSNYNGDNSIYSPERIFHEMQFGYALVEISGDSPSDCNVTIIWKQRVMNTKSKAFSYEATNNIIQYNVCNSSALNSTKKSDITLFPNPVNSFLYIQNNKPIVYYSLLSPDCRIIHRAEYTEQGIDFDGMPPGMYFVILETDDEVFARKVLKQ